MSSIISTFNGSTLVLRVNGGFTHKTYKIFQTHYVRIDDAHYKDIIVDFSGCTWIDSNGIWALVKLRRFGEKREKRVCFRNCSDDVKGVVRSAGIRRLENMACQ